MAFFQEFFSGGGGLKSIVMQIYIVMLIFILFLDQIPEGAKGEFFSGGNLPRGSVEESQSKCKTS